MEESQASQYVWIIMKNLNLLIILYVAILMSYSLYGYVHENSALDFLTNIYRMPIAAWKIPLISIGLYMSCLIFLYIQSVNNLELFLKVCIELGVSFFISYVLGFCYAGVVLLVLADTMRYFPESKWRFTFAISACVVYLLTDYNLLSVVYQITPLETYMEYFQNDARGILLGIKNVLSSLNMLVFLIYVILLVRAQLDEKARIISLNEKLNITNKELKLANMQLEEYAKESEKVAETRERNRLAREIHDTLGHSLTGIITGIEACTTLMDVAPEATKEQLKVIAEVARQGITDVRRSVKALRPDVLEKLNLEKALTQMIDETCNATGVEIKYHCMTRLNCFSEDEEDVIYRIVQECITNSIRHGNAKQIQIHIDREYNILKICIRDNGTGCKNVKMGFGLHHMEERLALLKGSLAYSGENGFMVKAEIPIRWGVEERNDDKNIDSR